jgi:methionine-S-sulfoxide reductase
MTMKTEKAIFAAGCFWGVQSRFSKLPGVIDTVVGYTGGTVRNPTYKMVCTDTTGHAEAVQVTYNPHQISYIDLLEAFFNMHDPTTPNRQGPDYGSQYRSAIFYLNEDQKEKALAFKAVLEESGKYRYPVVTEITAAGPFYEAEAYHQDYYTKHNFRCT